MAHKICLHPNHCQATYFARAAGTARFAYNWALAQWQKQYDAWKLEYKAAQRGGVVVSSTVSACGEEGAGRVRKGAVKPASVKQEASSRFS